MPSIKEKLTCLPGDVPSAAAQAEVFVMPATPGQARFWLLNRMRSDNCALNIAIAWTCRGKLDRDVMATALVELVHRHESLRTTFEEAGGGLSQLIHPSIEVPLPFDDLHLLSKEMRQQRRAAITMEHARIRMDLEKGPLFLVRLMQMDVDEHILLLTMHHSISDGWSNGVMLRDFAVIYDGLMRGVPPNLPDLPIQFGDYAVWLDEWRNGEEAAKSRDYWHRTIRGNFTELRVRPDFTDADADGNGEIETYLLTPELAQHVQDFCAVRGVTSYMLMLAVYAAMLHRLTGQRDFLIGTPSANRQSGTENLIGLFLNPQVIRIQIGKEDSLGALLEQVQKWTLGALDHVNFPFQMLDDEEFYMQPQNQLDYQVYFLFEKAFMRPYQTPSLDVDPLRSVSPGLMFDLVLSIVERAEGPRLQLEYNPKRFRVSTMQNMLRLYLAVLDTMLSNADNLVGGSMQGQQERLLNVSSNGKAGSEIAYQDASLNSHKNAASSKSTSFVGKKKEKFLAPRDVLEMQIARIWETAMGLSSLSVQDSFFDLGGKSLAAMRIVSRINKIYSLDFGLAALFSGSTVERMAELVRKRLAANSSSSIVPMHPTGSAAPLFIIHGAGGNIIRFYQLAMLVGTDHPIYGIQAQSLLADQPALLRLEDQAAFYLAEIREIQPKGPYYFLGYSYGGTVAFEIAQQLHALGEQVELLGMLDSWQRGCMVMVQKKDSVRAQLDRRIERFVGNFVSLSLREKVAYLQQKLFTRTLRRLYMAAAALGFRSVPSFMKSADDISWVAAMNYRPRPWTGPITLFRATVQPDPRLPQDLGWTPLAEDGIELYELPGDHDLVFREPNIQVLAAQLRARLERSDAAEVRLDEPAVIAK